MKLYLPITVDLYNIYPLRVLNLQQNNVGRGALITLTAAGVVIVPDSESLYVYAQKKDGTMVYNTCTLKDNQIQVDFDEQMTVESGILQVELQMVDTSGNSITTPIFQINVQKSNIDYQKITSQDSFQALVTTLAEVQELKKNGLKGDPGEAATIQIGTVTASDPGADPEVTNSGTQQDAVLNFVFPRGIQGPMGPKGDPGTANAATVAYDNSTSEAAETNAQDAFDKLYGDITQLTENSAYTPLTLLGTVDGIKLYYSRYGKNVMIKGEGKFSKEETIAPSAGLVLTTLPKDIKPSTTLFYSLNYLYTNASTLTLSILANGEVTICATGGSISIASGKYFNFTVEFIL